MNFFDFIFGKFKRSKPEVLIKEKEHISKTQQKEDCEKELYFFLKDKSGTHIGTPTK